MERKIILTSIAFFITISIFSQERWTLRQCIEYAREHNIEIMQRSLQVDDAKIRVNTSKMSRLPDLNGSVGQNFTFGRSPLSDNTFQSANSAATSFGVSSNVPLFTGFRIYNDIKVKELGLLSATANLEKARENIELQVASLYLEVLFKKELLKVYNEQVDLTTKQVERTKILVESGKVPRSQEYDIISELARDEMNVTNAKNDLDMSLLNLSQALNIMSDEAFDIVEPQVGNAQMEDNLSSIIPPMEIYQIAMGVKPHVKVAEYDLEGSKRELKVAKAAYFPSLSLSLGYSTDYRRVFGRANQSFGKQIENLGNEYIRFNLSIPIFNRFGTRNSVRSAKLNIENSQLVLDDVKLALFKEIQQAYQSATAAQAKFSSTEKAFFAAEESYKYAQDRYEVGKSSVFEYSEAQTKLLTSKSEQIQAKYDFIFRAKILDFYRGEEIDVK